MDVEKRRRRDRFRVCPDTRQGVFYRQLPRRLDCDRLRLSRRRRVAANIYSLRRAIERGAGSRCLLARAMGRGKRIRACLVCPNRRVIVLRSAPASVPGLVLMRTVTSDAGPELLGEKEQKHDPLHQRPRSGPDEGSPDLCCLPCHSFPPHTHAKYSYLRIRKPTTFVTPGCDPRHNSGDLSLHNCKASSVPDCSRRKFLILDKRKDPRCGMLRSRLGKFTQANWLVRGAE